MSRKMGGSSVAGEAGGLVGGLLFSCLFVGWILFILTHGFLTTPRPDSPQPTTQPTMPKEQP